MAEKPILFSAPMVRALLAGTKTQTRRIVKQQPREGEVIIHLGDGDYAHRCTASGDYWDNFRMPYAVGDLLWVRESYWPHEGGTVRDPGSGHVIDHVDSEIEYKADRKMPGGRWKPSIHMPRWASRITLKVTAVKVERLQDISEDDAKAEGMIWQLPTAEDLQWAAENDMPMEPDDGVWIAPGTRTGIGMTKEQRAQPHWGPTAAFAFRKTWEAINGAESWAANPWVAAYSFKRVPPPQAKEDV